MRDPSCDVSCISTNIQDGGQDSICCPLFLYSVPQCQRRNVVLVAPVKAFWYVMHFDYVQRMYKSEDYSTKSLSKATFWHVKEIFTVF